MKYTTFLVCILMSLKAISQPTTTYYDYNWKPCDPLIARFFSFLQKKDSGWLREDYYMSNKQLQMRSLYEDSACNVRTGKGIWYHPNGYISEISKAVHNKREGICLEFYSNGMMMDSADYHEGKIIGYELKWFRNGMLADSIAHVNDSMDVHVSWFDNGQPTSAGFLLNGKPHGKWQYFHKNGNKAADEVYKNGKIVSRQFYNEAGVLKADTAKSDRPAEFKGGLDGWRKYLERNLYWPPGYKFDNGNMAVVGVDLIIGEDGKLEFAEVTTPFHPEFDKIALRTVQQSPQWKPAISHNRAVKYRFRQSVTFQQPEQ